jgi:hypothetical protein
MRSERRSGKQEPGAGGDGPPVRLDYVSVRGDIASGEALEEHAEQKSSDASQMRHKPAGCGWAGSLPFAP